MVGYSWPDSDLKGRKMEHHSSGMRERDLVLPPNTFAFVLDRTKGKVSSFVGPHRTSLSDTDHLVVWRDGKFVQTNDFDQAIQPFTEASEGEYIVLSNPSHGDDQERFPTPGIANDAIGLATGRKIVIHGPANFPLWPGQQTQVIDGHNLRHNEYLVARVYEPEAAKENAGKAFIAPAGDGDDATPDLSRDLTMGQLIVIKGNDVSFFMPYTGIEVVPEGYHSRYVRDAVTLEQLEYCVLLDESGAKRYERGPKVVFPEPTEEFDTDDEGNRKFRAIELNKQSGLYIKVIAPYTEGDREYSEGEELFLTGEDTPIYFPRVEHWIIQYGENRKHHAIAIPEGEGRYVLDRTSGEVSLIKGPKMFLPDPRNQVIVRRILQPDLVTVMFPGNEEALAVNQAYREEQQAKARRAGGLTESVYNAAAMDVLNIESESMRAGGSHRLKRAAVSTEFAGEKLTRGTEYTPPRTITLETKYEGAVTIAPWPGYAILVMDKAGHRRVEVGPKVVLLDYDEAPMVLSLSTGRPKSDDRKLRTPYLRTVNNSVSDKVTVETKDLVPVTLELSLRVNFEGNDKTKWFDVEDYVGLLTDHVRSKLRNLAKRHDIQDFYTQTIDLIRDTLLGEVPEEGDRPGLPFAENGMRLYDVEVLNVNIVHAAVASILQDAMDKSLRGAIRVAQAEQETARIEALEGFARERLKYIQETRELESKQEIAAIARKIKEQEQEAKRGLLAEQDATAIQMLRRAESLAEERQDIEIERTRNEVEVARLREEVTVQIDRAKAIDPTLATAIANFGDQEFVNKLVEGVGPIAAATGVTSADLFAQIFSGTPFEGMMNSLSERPFAAALGEGGNGHHGE